MFEWLREGTRSEASREDESSRRRGHSESAGMTESSNAWCWQLMMLSLQLVRRHSLSIGKETLLLQSWVMLLIVLLTRMSSRSSRGCIGTGVPEGARWSSSLSLSSSQVEMQEVSVTLLRSQERECFLTHSSVLMSRWLWLTGESIRQVVQSRSTSMWGSISRTIDWQTGTQTITQWMQRTNRVQHGSSGLKEFRTVRSLGGSTSNGTLPSSHPSLLESVGWHGPSSSITGGPTCQCHWHESIS